ncbi:hypothetical protein ACLOJK_017900 [Asimina triloba]
MAFAAENHSSMQRPNPAIESPSVAFSGPLNGGGNRRGGGSRRSARFKDDDALVEIQVREDSVSVNGVRVAGSSEAESAPPPRSMSVRKQLSVTFRHVSQELKRIASSSMKSSKLDRSQSGAARALRGLQFMTKSVAGGKGGWEKVEKRFDELAVDGALPRAKFGQCIGMKELEFAGEMFDALARRRGITTPSITKFQLQQFWEQLSDPSFDARLQTFFDMVDKNADGRITEEEIKEIIMLSASCNKLAKIKERADEYAALIMEELDPDCIGYIELHNLETLLLQAPNEPAAAPMNRNLSKVLSQRLVRTKERNPIRRGFRKLGYLVQDNWKRIWVVALWVGICAGLFTWKFVQYRQRAAFKIMGYCLTTAKGAAETIKLNMALILLPVCRNTITWLRNRTKLGGAVPFDDNINFHKVIAFGVAVGVAVHGLAHLTCDFPELLHASEQEYAPLKPYFGERKPRDYWWFVKGTEGWTGLTMVLLMAISCTLAQPWFRRNEVKLPKLLRRLTGFNAFWYSHHLFVIVYALLIVHGVFLYLTKEWYKKTTWMYLAIPVFLYACERLVRAFRSEYKPVKILKVAVYPGNVLGLRMSKPQGFKYKSGQYIFVNCAEISAFEWHPFSLTSAPGDDYVSVHIRNRGDWTKRIHSVFSEVCVPAPRDQSGLLKADLQEDTDTKCPKILIDGPYGAPAQDYTDYDVLLLVGLGIGATPFISIIKDLLYKIQERERGEMELEDGGGHMTAPNSKPIAMSQAYFYWVTPEAGSFDWFRGVMNEIADKDHSHVIEIHNHCTSVYEEGDARSALIAMLQCLQHAKNGVDVVSGTRVKTHFARPNWRAVFKQIAVNHPEKRVGVFYCGPSGLTTELRRLSHRFSHKTSTKFEFHKENF